MPNYGGRNTREISILADAVAKKARESGMRIPFIASKMIGDEELRSLVIKHLGRRGGLRSAKNKHLRSSDKPTPPKTPQQLKLAYQFEEE